MFIKHIEVTDTAFEVYKIYLEGDHYTVVGAWVNIISMRPFCISEDTIYIPEDRIHDWILTKAEEYQELKTCSWYPLRGNI